MKRICSYIIAPIIGALFFSLLLLAANGLKLMIEDKNRQPGIIEKYVPKPLSGWDALTLALIKTESNFDSTAINGDAWGLLQIRPCYVKEVNRILGVERFTHEDALSVQGSLLMHFIFQEYYNPEHIIERAIELHNPTAGLCYRDKVLRNYRDIIKYEDIRNALTSEE